MTEIQNPDPGAGSRIHLNHAPTEDLASLPGIDATLAKALVEARPFTNWDEVERTPGLSAEAAAALRSAGVALGEPGEGPIGEPGSGGEPGLNLGRA